MISSFETLLPDLGATIIIESLWRDKKQAKLASWLEDIRVMEEVIKVVMGIAKYMGFSYLRLLIDKELYHKYFKGLKHNVIEEYLVLIRKLR
ncbi:MAG: hypothetical protein DRJ66_07675 [Thermoprotei archaeon]|nr:MAG: hypothetical protein DRJ66_07675 [Thermoprotei archaeon]